MDTDRIEKAIREILIGIGEDPERPGIKDTPRRVARMYEELFSGLDSNPAECIQVMPEEHDEIILVRDIPFYSICEHHLIPFHGKAHVAYIPDGSITGLSKIARVVDTAAKKPQLQERLTGEIADVINSTLNPKGVMVIIEAEHLCMTMRGVRKPGAITITSVVRGLFRTNQVSRMEAMQLVREK